jgi:endonuclease YncB( thermonuclease family)
MLRHGATIVALLAFAVLGPRLASAEPVDAVSLRVIDGDTVTVAGVTYRLVGFDAPEEGSRARCVAEAALAERATSRLRAIVAAGGLDLARVACACRPATEGTPFCNFGRLCAVLRSDGQDVADIMIREGLAHRLACGPTRCPRREPWC